MKKLWNELITKCKNTVRFFLPWSWLWYVDIDPLYPLGRGRTLNVHKKFIGLKVAPQRSSYIKVLLRKTTIWNHSSAWVLSCEFVAYFQNNFPLEYPWRAASGGHPGQPLNVLYTFNLRSLTKEHWFSGIFFIFCWNGQYFLIFNYNVLSILECKTRLPKNWVLKI